jgi:ADP-ribosyl-[dinitrogen reductase] hydrolase
MDPSSQYRGALLGLAVGDALGVTVEFQEPRTFKPVKDLVGGGVFQLLPGQWTDDTSMALCLAESLVECCNFDPADQMTRYCRWYREGYLSSTGVAFDVGNTTRGALEQFLRTHEPYAGPTDPQSAGNGSLMRLAPVPLFFCGDPLQAIEKSGLSSRITHGAIEAVDACRYFGGLLVGALQGRSKEVLLKKHFCPVPDLWEREPLAPNIAEIAAGSYKYKNPPNIIAAGYVVKTLEAALWAFFRSASFEEGALLAVNLGNDADTVGAVYGQIAGAYYGAEAIPKTWREKITRRERIELLADELLHLS